ncbi:glycosyltransferase family 4 protein [Tatumella terrea]|uniref:glycosyltransferase family 4 protein n=1 Tax=Tatumella terrea TaxID=419007 RepID=UPI0031D9DC1A
MKTICYFVNSDWYFDLHWLARALSAKHHGYEVHIITRISEEKYLRRFTELGLCCHSLPIKERSCNIFGFIAALVSSALLLRRIKPALIHAVTIKPVIIGGLYARLFSVPFVANIAGLGRVFQPENWLYRRLKKAVCLCYSVIFANPRSRIIFEHHDDLLEFQRNVTFSVGRASVIDGCGVDVEQYAFSEEEACDPPIVLFASRMLHKKGLAALVRIKQQLAREDVYFTLRVAGIMVADDPDAIALTDITRWAAAGDIEWLGTCNNMEVLLGSASIVALPTLYPEGVPRILIEGAAKGRACIAYNSGGCNSIVINNVNGFLISRGDEDEFCRQLKVLIGDRELRQQMGLQGRTLVLDKFSAAQVITNTLNIYRILMVP